MLRSFFIGFLILSALTSKGAEIQINQKAANIPAEMLLELFNAAFSNADKQTELPISECERAFYSNRSESRYSTEKLLGKIRDDKTAEWIMPTGDVYCTDLQSANIELPHIQFCASGVCTCASGLSPPDFSYAS